MGMRAVGIFAAVVLSVSSAQADCRDDLIKADQNFNKTRSALQKAATAAPPVKCAAYRQHIASLNLVKGVFARCDTSATKAKNAAQTNSAITEFTKQMRSSCPAAPAAPKKSAPPQ
jgi:hypothetical protein